MTLRYFCVDNFHRGSAAHIEVWGKRGRYLGEIDLDGEGGIKSHSKGHNKNNSVWFK